MNVCELSFQSIEKYGEFDSLYFKGRWHTNKEMLERGMKIAAGLSKLGVKQGDRVAMVLSNCPEVLNTFNASFMMGAWCMPVMFTLTAEEIGYIFGDAEPSVVITQKLFLEKIIEARKRAPSIRDVILVDEDKVEGTIRMRDWFEGYDADFQPISCEPDDLALLMYTSGTTGMPKGVMLTHDNLLFTAISSSKARGIKEGATFASCLPLNHSYGIILWISSEYFGVRNILMDRFDEDELLRIIHEFKCTATSLVPTMIVRLLNHPNPDKYDLSRMERWASAAAPLPVEYRKRFEDKFPGRVIEAYGLTECSPTVTVNRMDMPYKDGSVGTAIEGVGVSIQDGAGKILPPGETGEICVRGRNMMKGYYNRPEATAEVIRDGWLLTGDAGYLDEEGYLFLTDRIKDLIIRGGENIFPKDIEEVLVKHEKVNEAAVIGMPHEDLGEEVMAVIVPAEGCEPGADEIIGFCRGSLGKFQVPKRVEFVSSLPKNAIGKLLKRELRKQYFGR